MRDARAPIRGQAAVVIVGALCVLLILAFLVGAVARALGTRSDAQQAADLAALAGARAMLTAYPRLFEPPDSPAHLDKPAYLELGRTAAVEVVRRNGAGVAAVAFPDADTIAPVRIRVEVRRAVMLGRTHHAPVSARADAELEPAGTGLGPSAAAGEYSGPFAERQGKRMRPDVAQAFDRLDAAATAAGVPLIINSAYRSDAEQAVLFAQHPDPKWVAPPGKSLHRLGTELDLGPSSAYGWLAANAGRFHFTQRYAWEPWHYGWSLNAHSAPAAAAGEHADGHSAIPSFVPAAYAGPIARAAQRWSVSATLLAAQLYQESGFNPFAISGAGAQGIAQFMPGTARAYGLGNPFDAAASIDAQAHLMRDLLRQFGSVPLALAAYNAGPAPVAACSCIPPIPETQGYVTRILGLMGGAGDASAGALAVRLVA